jgi:hypothetical protein
LYYIIYMHFFWSAKMAGFAHGASKVRGGHACLVVVLCFGALMAGGLMVGGLMVGGKVVVKCADIVMSETKESFCGITEAVCARLTSLLMCNGGLAVVRGR